MPQIATLTTPVAGPSKNTYEIVNSHFDKEAPSIKVTVKFNTGERVNVMFVPDDNNTAAQILTGLSFINQGKFKTVQGLSMEDWLLKKIAAEKPGFAATVSGTEF